MAKGFLGTVGRDPATQLKLLTTATGIKRIGTETVDGVSTTHYQGTVNLPDIPAPVKPSTPNFSGTTAPASPTPSTQQQGATTETVDAWIGPDNLPVRVTTAVRADQATIKSTMDFSDYSPSPLTVTAPPSSDTISYASAMSDGTS